MSPHPPMHHSPSAGSGLIDLGALDEGVVVAGHDLQVHHVSRAATDVFGWAADANGQDLRETLWSALAPGDLAAITSALATGRRWDGAVDIATASGGRIPAVVSVSASRGEADLPDGVVVVLRPAEQGTAFDLDDGAEPLEGFCVAGLPGRFVLHHRPEVDVHDSVVTSCEAVLRWWHPGLGLVSPGGALREAYGADHLAAVEIWAVFAAFRKAAAWAEADRPVRLSIGLSGRRLADRDLLRRVRTALGSSGVPPQCVAVRMPGPAFSAMPREAHRAVQALRNEGVATIVDDVTGPLAPAVLDPGVVAGVTLHRSVTDWIDTATGQEAVTTVVARAHAAGAVVGARGISDLAQLDLARALGCDQASGDVLSPPCSPVAVWPLLGRALRAPAAVASAPAPTDDVAPSTEIPVEVAAPAPARATAAPVDLADVAAP